MEYEIIGQVTESEKNEIVRLKERISALLELSLGKDNLNLNEEEKQNLLKKINQRKEETNKSIEQWWEAISNKYKWKSDRDAKWIIRPEDCNVLLLNK